MALQRYSAFLSDTVLNVEWRRNNREWLRWHREVALSLVEYMEANGMNWDGVAAGLDVTSQNTTDITNVPNMVI